MNAKAAASRYQRHVADISRQPGNDVCADCGGRNPRWASHNLGIFLCVQCASVHRKMGTHISKVKSLTLDQWTKEQVDRMREYGNIKSNAYYNPNETRNRPPANLGDGERDSEMERFIRNKYEFRRFIDKRPPPLPTKEPYSPASLQTPSYNARTASSSSTHSARLGWGNASQLSPVEMRPGQSSSSLTSRGLEPLSPSSSQRKSIHRSKTAPLPASWQEAKRAVSPLPALPSSTQQAPSLTTPAISITSARAPTLSSSSAAPLASSSHHLSSSYQPAANGSQHLGGPASLPQRASSAQAYSSPSTHLSPNGTATVSGSQQPNGYSSSAHPTSTPAMNFSGRSAVFDDLLELTKPASPVPQAPSCGGVGNPWAGGGNVVQGTMNGMNAGGGVMNPWAQQQQQQPLNVMLSQPTGLSYGPSTSAGYFQQAGSGPQAGHLTPQNLGSMAFSPHLSPHVQQQQPIYSQNQSFPSFNAGVGGGASTPINPFSGYQQQPLQMGQQPLQPQQTVQVMGQQRLQEGQVFQDWASRMMPSQQQQGGGAGWR